MTVNAEMFDSQRIARVLAYTRGDETSLMEDPQAWAHRSGTTNLVNSGVDLLFDQTLLV